MESIVGKYIDDGSNNRQSRKEVITAQEIKILLAYIYEGGIKL
jgi:hypothetical protein